MVCLLLLAVCRNASALPIDSTEAQERVRAAFGKEACVRGVARDVQLLSRSSATYLFGGSGSIFILAAADDDLPAVLAYGAMRGGEMPPALQELIAAYDRLQRLTPNVKKSGCTPIANAVEPLLTTRRSQYDPYNRLCPTYASDNGEVSTARCVVGCVATALEQILTYHRRVYTLQDTLKGWTTDHYTIADELPGQSVDTRGIASDYGEDATDAEADAVARLSYWLGMAVHMNWGLSESGASSHRALEPLRRIFGLPYVEYVDRYKYSPADWREMLHNELRAHRPIYYAGAIQRMGGHAFVLDGINEEGFYHVNWGYGGEYDGYFDLDVLNFAEPAYDTTPQGYQNGFFCNQEALFISPDTVREALPDTLSRSGEEIRVTSWQCAATPMKDVYTPVVLTLRNTTAEPLTTTFELFTNLESDTAVFSQADYIALTGITLAGGEERTLTVDVCFGEAGTRLLRLSADDVHFQTLGEVAISPHYLDDLTYLAPHISFPSDSTAVFVQTITNADAAARAGRYVTYELQPLTSVLRSDAVRHGHYFYLDGGAVLNDTVAFRGLTPGATYCFRVRCPWTIQQEVAFTLPTASGIREITTAKSDGWHTLDGRRIAAPQVPGIYIHNGRKVAWHRGSGE